MVSVLLLFCMFIVGDSLKASRIFNLSRKYCALNPVDRQMSNFAVKGLDGGLDNCKSQIKKNKVIILAGPTAVGKSSVARELSRQLSAEIVIADSVQVYKHLDIGSNKPDATEQAETPHHLVDFVDPSSNDTCSAGDFVRMAVPAIRDILERGNVPIVVGGSTMWIDWLVHGTPDAPKADNVAVTKAEEYIGEYEKAGDWDSAFLVLERHDKRRAEALPRGDWYRLRRFLEVALSVSLSMEESGSMGKDKDKDVIYTDTVVGSRTPVLPECDIRCFFISENREDLYRTIDARCMQLMELGLLEEVTELIVTGKLHPGSMGAKAIGYRQTLDYFNRENSVVSGDMQAFQQYVQDFAKVTRNYAQRQMKWFRKDSLFVWLLIEPTLRKDAKLRVADEILHWCNQTRGDFVNCIRRQQRRVEAVSEIRRGGQKKAKLPDHYNQASIGVDKVMDSVVYEMLKCGELNVSTEITTCKFVSGDQSLKDEWSSEKPMLRAPERAQSVALRTYTSVLATPVDQAPASLSTFWKDMLMRADACVQRLRDECPEALEGFKGDRAL